MKNTLFHCLLVIFGFIALTACNSEEKEIDKKPKEENLIEIKDGVFTEFYPGRKKVKFTGRQDDNQARHGRWVFLGENGQELSVTHYIHGVKEGFSIVKHPNGALHYHGEYRNDTMVGVWKTYDIQGNLVTEINYDTVEK
jgi:antitoxin component YwqK of YwqJK toxin-antitoxin module